MLRKEKNEAGTSHVKSEDPLKNMGKNCIIIIIIIIKYL